jgi:hypothetical protein
LHLSLREEDDMTRLLLMGALVAGVGLSAGCERKRAPGESGSEAVGRSIGKGARQAKEGAQELGREIKQGTEKLGEGARRGYREDEVRREEVKPVTGRDEEIDVGHHHEHLGRNYEAVETPRD